MAAMDNPDILLQRPLNVSPKRVFRAWTDPNELERWFFTDCQIDARLGGVYRFNWRAKDNPNRDHARFGTILDFEEPRALSFEWDGFRIKRQEKPTAVSISIEDTEDGSMLTLVHSGWGDEPEWQEERRSHIAGWSFYLDNLKRFLEGGPDLRPQHWGQLVKATFGH